VSLFEMVTVAQGWASAAEAEHHAPSIHELWFPLVNFLIFAYLIKRFAIPVVADFLRSRREEVLSAMNKAAEAKRRAEALVEHYKNRLARLDEEIQSIHSSLRAEGEREKNKLLHEADALATKIKEDARFLAAQELKIARQEIRQEIAEQAEAAARELVQRHLSPSDQARLVEDFIQNVERIR